MWLRTVRPDDFWLVIAIVGGFVAFKRGERFQ